MLPLTTLRKLVLTAAISIAAPLAAHASVFISVGFAPPILPVYAQPICPNDGYIWTPGYWAYAPAGGYYWVPGVWIQPPTPGFLWTPAYWGYENNVYLFHSGYWGPHIGFYGGINYGFGYGGHGYDGGYWNGGHFFYNTAVNRVNVVNIHNTYVRNVTVVNNEYAHTSYNGGPHGVPYHADAQEAQAMHENHVQPTAMQQQHFQTAAATPGQRFSANNGHPGVTAAATPAAFHQQALGTPAQRDGFGTRNEVNTRQGNQQARINNGVRSGQMTPGETRNVENRDASINRQANVDRSVNGGQLTGQERQQINQRQNNVSQSINRDNHNANTDAAAAARQGRAAGGEQRQAQRTEHAAAPHPHEDHPKR